ncbi:hypothetical protein [Labilibacter marinus]|uniref:hypothetical protein n=1 Tax=Labilibacter marinus TaxID=1477105 RepID=UPI00094F5A6C|nr:hypothetical protein [Labilibacter marinus]
MKQNILYPFYLENSNIKSQSIAVELAKNLGVDLHILVIIHNNNFLYNEYLECAKTQEESSNELFDSLNKRYSDIILGNDKPIGHRHGTRIDISFENYQDCPLQRKLSESYLWVFDYQDFISNIIPAGFNNELKEHDRKVWIISKNRSGILTQTQPLINQFSNHREHTINDVKSWDAFPLDIM